MKRKLYAPALALCLAPCAVSPAPAGVALTGRAFDGESSARAILDAMRQGQTYAPSLKAPFARKEVTVELLAAPQGGREGGGAARTWKATTDDNGAFSIDTGLERWPEKPLIVVRAEIEGRSVFSPFLKADAESQDVHLYPSTESPDRVTPKVEVAYDVQKSSEGPRLRVRVGVSLLNRGGELYVGRKAGSPWREVWRIPLPRGSVVTRQAGPYDGVEGWKQSRDGRSLVLDAPVPGICDFAATNKPWEVEYLAPARQSFVQSYPAPIPFDPQAFTVWCAHEEMRLDSPLLKNRDSGSFRDPFTGQERHLDVVFTNSALEAGAPIPVILSVDNVAIGETVSLGALKWVGGFVLVLLLSTLLGLALGPKGPPAEVLLESLSGDEALDRLADLDRRFAQGEIAERDYRRLREPLVGLAAEEVGAEQASGPTGAGDAAALPQGAREILRRIDEIDRNGRMDPALIAERAHLLEALAKALPREAQRG